jgi:HPt (histidine-containing phosphotransfer) domain-containing protein
MEAAHTIKGSAAAVGASAVARIAGEAEQLRPLPSRQSREAVLAELKAAVADAVRFATNQSSAT